MVRAQSGRRNLAEIGKFRFQTFDIETNDAAAGEDQRHDAGRRIAFGEFDGEQIEPRIFVGLIEIAAFAGADALEAQRRPAAPVIGVRLGFDRAHPVEAVERASTKRCSRGRQKMSATLTSASCTWADTTSMSSLSRATSLSSSGAGIHRDRPCLRSHEARKDGRAARKARRPGLVQIWLRLERDAGASHDDDDRILAKFVLVRRRDGIEPRFVVVVAGQHDFNAAWRVRARSCRRPDRATARSLR